MIRFGACECCAVLKDEVLFLRTLARPKTEPKQEMLPRITFEADGVLSGQDHQTDFDMNPKIDVRQADIDSEAAKLLAGTY